MHGGCCNDAGRRSHIFSLCDIVMSVMVWWSAKGLVGVRRMGARVQWGAQKYGGDTRVLQHFCPVP